MGQVALVTGGGRGLGKAFAAALAQSGMKVAVASRTAEELNETVVMLQTLGGEAIGIPTDVTDEGAVRYLVATTERELGPIDLLLNCAGAGGPFGPTWETEPADWWRNVEVNLKGPMLCCHAVSGGMRARGSGRIINVASGAGTVSIPYMSAYVTAKAALIRFTEVLGAELRPHGVSIFAIQPGTVRTALAEELMNSEAGERWLPWFREIFEQGRDDSTEPGTRLILHLASGQADALTGRFFQAPGAPENLDGATEQILRQDLNVLRLR